MPKLHILAAVTNTDEKLFFALALAHHLKRRGRGAITGLANDTGMSQPQISRIMSGASLGSVEARIKIAEALGTTVEQLLILGRSLKSGDIKSGDRRSGEPGRRAQDKERGYPHLHRMLELFPNARRYIQMAELAAAENDIPLVLNLLRSAIAKVDEGLKDVESEPSGDHRNGVGGQDL